MMSLSFIILFLIDVLPAAYRDDHFQFVAIDQCLSSECATRYDVPIALKGDAFAGQSHLFDECGDSEACLELARYAIDAKGDHFAQIARVRIRAAFYYMRV
jgi:hypothetical protein